MKEQFDAKLAACENFLRSSCSFTGHRRKKLPWRNDEAAPGCIALKEHLTAEISALADRGLGYFISGMADGIDWYASEAVLKLREKIPRSNCYALCRALIKMRNGQKLTGTDTGIF